MSEPSLVEKALAARRESRRIEFKESCDFLAHQDCCEVIKDVVAIANSGGGVLLFGVSNTGVPLGTDLAAPRSIDPATVADRIHKYTETNFADFEIVEVEKGGHTLVAWLVGESPSPIAFAKPGTYPNPVDASKQKTAFGQGTVYFRHGAKSEPGTTADIAAAFERRIDAIRKEWQRGVRKVVEAPSGSIVSVASGDVRQSTAPDAAPVRITEDPTAPAYRLVDPDQTHPYRQKELIEEVRRLLPAGTPFNQHDVQSIRRAYGIDANLEFAHKSRFGSTQFSPAFATWIVSQVSSKPDFLKSARAKYRDS